MNHRRFKIEFFKNETCLVLGDLGDQIKVVKFDETFC